LKIEKINPQHFLDYRNFRKKDGIRTTNLDLVMFHTLFEKAIKLWQIPFISNPLKYVEKFPEKKGRYRPIYFYEYRRILYYSKNSNFKFYISIIILKNCGLRPSELISLFHDDLDQKAKLLIIRKTKNNKIRTVPVSNFIINLIQKSKIIYNSKSIIPYTIHGFNSAFRRMKYRLGIIDLEPHDFRRSFAKRFLDANKGDITKLAKLGGWSSWDMVQRYYGK
jgi:integrase